MKTLMEDGKFVIDETDYSRLRFRALLALPDEWRAKHKKLSDLLGEVEKLEKEIKKYVVEEFHPKSLPVGFSCEKVEIDKYSVNATWSATGAVSVERIIKNDPEKTAPEKKEPSIYEKLSLRHDFKQILSSGILSKSERRKCLGLPPLPDNEEDSREQ